MKFNPALCRRLAFSIFIFYSLCAMAIQPLDVIATDPPRYQVRQGAAQCGPAAFYTIFRYYGDDSRSYMFSNGSYGPLIDLSCDSNSPGNTAYVNTSTGVVVTEGCAVSAWMKGTDISTGWEKLSDAIRDLCFVNSTGQREKYYTVVESYDYTLSGSEKDYDVRKINFHDRILKLFINRNRPVIIHLKRRWPFPGHYIVLIGYNSSSSTVYYMDPNSLQGDVVKSVVLDDFLENYWYAGRAPFWWGKARWSGKWIGFYRIGKAHDKN